MSEKIIQESILNQQGFDGDIYLAEKVAKIVKDNNIQAIIETGTFYGNTTKKLAKLVPYVVTIDEHKYYHNKSKARFAEENIDSHNLNKKRGILSVLGRSEDKLKGVIAGLPDECQNLLFYLDANKRGDSALLSELAIIASERVKPIIVISGFKVPSKRFAQYKGKEDEYNIKSLREALNGIYGDYYKYHYNDKAAGMQKGVIFIYPKGASVSGKVINAKKSTTKKSSTNGNETTGSGSSD